MRLHLPNSAFLGNIETYVRRVDSSAPESLEVTFNDRWVAVHPLVLATVACAGATVRARGGIVGVAIPSARSLPYFVRMRLFEHLGVDPGLTIQEHEAAGRFIPLTQIRTKEQLSAFIIDMIPLLHATPQEADPIKYVVSELVRNALEHSRSQVGAFVCAQYFSTSGRLAIAVADSGIGILGSMQTHHHVATAEEAIALALQPGVTGTTSKWGGTEYNAGAGLFFTKAIACASRNFFVAYSGDAMFKLRRTAAGTTPRINPDPADDVATRHADLPPWPGTAVGIDVSMDESVTFDELLSDIRDVYFVDVRKRKRTFKKARFA